MIGRIRVVVGGVQVEARAKFASRAYWRELPNVEMRASRTVSRSFNYLPPQLACKGVERSRGQSKKRIGSLPVHVNCTDEKQKRNPIDCPIRISTSKFTANDEQCRAHHLPSTSCCQYRRNKRLPSRRAQGTTCPASDVPALGDQDRGGARRTRSRLFKQQHSNYHEVHIRHSARNILVVQTHHRRHRHQRAVLHASASQQNLLTLRNQTSAIARGLSMSTHKTIDKDNTERTWSSSHASWVDAIAHCAAEFYRAGKGSKHLLR